MPSMFFHRDCDHGGHDVVSLQRRDGNGDQPVHPAYQMVVQREEICLRLLIGIQDRIRDTALQRFAVLLSRLV